MAEEERKTKAQRKAEARAERKRKEEEAARQQKRTAIRNAVIAVAVVAVIALVSVPAVMNLLGDDGDATLVSQSAALDARQSASCEMVVDGEPLEDSTHLDPETAPPADALYADSPVRPTASGPHFANQAGPIAGVPAQPLDERQVTHNLEHGAMLVWFDPDRVDQSTVDDMEDWMLERMDMGFESRAGGNVYVSPFDGETDAPIAIRLWGYALDCQEWDRTVADSMLIDYYGTKGIAPERSLSPYPEGSLAYGTDESDGTTGSDTEDATDSGTAPAADDATDQG